MGLCSVLGMDPGLPRSLCGDDNDDTSSSEDFLCLGAEAITPPTTQGAADQARAEAGEFESGALPQTPQCVLGV